MNTGSTATGRFLHAVPAGTDRALCGVPVMVSATPYDSDRGLACPKCTRKVTR